MTDSCKNLLLCKKFKHCGESRLERNDHLSSLTESLSEFLKESEPFERPLRQALLILILKFHNRQFYHIK